jgi:hypothetical protein
VSALDQEPDNPSAPAVSRRLGLAASILVFVGYIVGASIFILPGTLGGTTGPGLFVSYILAAIPAAFSAAVLAYVGSAYPVSGSIFVVIKQTLPPYFSALMVMAYLMLLLTALPLVAYGFADYIIYFWSGGNRQTLAAGIVLFFALVNSRGVLPGVIDLLRRRYLERRCRQSYAGISAGLQPRDCGCNDALFFLFRFQRGRRNRRRNKESWAQYSPDTVDRNPVDTKHVPRDSHRADDESALGQAGRIGRHCNGSG